MQHQRQQSHRRMAAAVLGAIAGLTACSDDAVGPVDEVEFAGDIALIAADAVDEDLHVMGGMIPSGSFGVDGRTITRTRTFFDAGGAEMEAYDPFVTASILVETETTGDVSRGGLELSIHRTRTMTVSGLEGEETERTFDGVGADARSRVLTTDTFGQRNYTLSGTLLVDGVVRAVDRQTRPWPLAGTITRTITVEIVNGPNGDETRSTVVTVTFDGTRYATMTIDGEVFEIDLAQQGRNRVHRGRGGHGPGA